VVKDKNLSALVKNKERVWRGANNNADIAKYLGYTRSNISMHAKNPKSIENLRAYDLYTTAKKHNLTLEDAHQALIMFAEVKKHIKEKI